MDKYQNKYRIPSAQLQNWNYRSAGAYFITTNTRNGEYYFGNVVDAKMQLSNIGVIADILWYEIINPTKNVELGECMVMPNHIHGILILNGNGYGYGCGYGGIQKYQKPTNGKNITKIGFGIIHYWFV